MQTLELIEDYVHVPKINLKQMEETHGLNQIRAAVMIAQKNNFADQCPSCIVE
jgi:mannose/fructose/N-acetylgalactosamine-specific phosphotransferase system component IIB